MRGPDKDKGTGHQLAPLDVSLMPRDKEEAEEKRNSLLKAKTKAKKEKLTNKVCSRFGCADQIRELCQNPKAERKAKKRESNKN